MEYTKVYKTKKGETRYVFDPPLEAKKAGILRRVLFRDGRKARYEIPRLLEKLEAFNRGEIVGDSVREDSFIKHHVAHYLNSKVFLSLSNSSQSDYENTLWHVCNTKVDGKALGDIRLNKLDTRTCNKYYEKWVEEKGTYAANRYSLLFGIVLTFCASLDFIQSNPMARVKKLKHEPESLVWTRKQVEDFLEVSFSEFKYRNIGLMVLMCYEWAQRPIDIRRLKWENINFEEAKVKIKQTKRGATVELPIDEELLQMLTQQKEEWGFQEYVVPHYRASDNAYRMMSPKVMADLVNEVKEKANIPKELLAGHLRKTAINEMVEAGVDSVHIMQVTGHKNISSLNPYLKHTYQGAKTALDKRKSK